MNFPLVTRSHHDEVVKLLGDRIDELICERETLQRALRRLQDKGFIDQWGFQLYDSLPQSTLPKEPTEPELSDVEKEEKELTEEHQRDLRELASLKRTKPSLLGPRMEQILAKQAANRANAAHPARDVFQAAAVAVAGRMGKA
jgi:hypothetical protein